MPSSFIVLSIVLTYLTIISSSPSKIKIVKDEAFKNIRIETLVDVTLKSRGDTGCDRRCGKGDLVTVHYERKLIEKDGKLSQMLDSSYSREEPFDFRVGAGQVMPGLEQGVMGMCPGDKRRVHVPAQMTSADEFNLKDDQSYVIEVELLKSERVPDVFGLIDRDADKELTREEVHVYLRDAASRQGSKPGVGSEPSVEALVEEIFKNEDGDNNGIISHAEFSGPKHEEL